MLSSLDAVTGDFGVCGGKIVILALAPYLDGIDKPKLFVA